MSTMDFVLSSTTIKMELDEQSTESRGKGNRKKNTIDISALTRETLNTIQRLYPGAYLHSGTKRTFHDMTSTGYGWLLPGWVAEERRVQSGRVYRYYYDPKGNFYKTQRKVIAALEKRGLVVIDK